MRKIYQNAPQSPGVYLMKDRAGRVLYIGKAANLRRRVASYFQRANDARIEKLVSKISEIDYKKTDSALEALILEAKLIKKYQPPFNVREKDDKSFLYVEFTVESYPRILLVRGNIRSSGERFGPFASAASVREALRILHRIFPWNSHPESEVGKAQRPCFNFELGLCPGTCVGAVSQKDYSKNIRRLRLFLGGKKRELVLELEREMKAASKKLEFEKATKFRKQLFALRHIRDTALISEEQIPGSGLEVSDSRRIEGYDISNVSGTSAVGSMVVFRGIEPDKNEYRKFRIRTITQSDDVGMLREVLRRRFKNDWPLPDLALVDGGRGQVNAALGVLDEIGLKIPVVGIAKGPERKKNEFIGRIPAWSDRKTLIRVRDEAHRFALGYHRRLRTRNLVG